MQIFTFKEQQLTVYGTSEKPLFRAKEVALMLDYDNTRQAIINNVDAEDIKRWDEIKGGYNIDASKTRVYNIDASKTRVYNIDASKTRGSHNTPLQNIHPHAKFINESGLYSLIIGSKKPIAKKFKHWITSEVLPSIRKTGKYEYCPTYISDDKTMTITSETSLQIQIIKFLRSHQETYNLKIIAPMGELQDTPEKRKYARMMGYEAGQPDIIINNCTYKYNGLIIELKSPKGTGEVSDKQKNVIERYREDGYKVIVSNDLCDIVRRLTLFFEKIRLPCRYCSCKFKTHETREKHIKFVHKK